jgi:hypothetical protein
VGLAWLCSMSGPAQGQHAESTVSLFKYLAARESCSRSSSRELAAAYQTYRFLVPNTTARLRAREFSNAHFSPDGRWLVGIQGSGHSVSVFKVGGSAKDHPQATSGPNEASKALRQAAASQRAVRTTGSNGASSSAHPSAEDMRSRDSSWPTLRPRASAAARQQTHHPHAVPAQAHTRAPQAAFVPRRMLHPSRPPSAPSSGNTCRAISGAPPRPRQATPLAPIASHHRSERFRIAWRKREREQRALIDEWERSRRCLRKARKTLATPTAHPRAVAHSAHACLPPPATTPLLFAGDTPDVVGPAAHFTAMFSASVTRGGQTLGDDVCIFTPDGRHVLVIAESPSTAATDEQASKTATVLMVSLRNGTVVDTVHLPGERLLQRSRRAGAAWSLFGDALVLLASRRQEVHVHRCTAQGFVHMCTLGEHVHEDSGWVLQDADRAEAQHKCDIVALNCCCPLLLYSAFQCCCIPLMGCRPIGINQGVILQDCS